jgi:hypothetical protein
VKQLNAQQYLKACANDLRCGCDGGNLEGRLWYFGLEPGGFNRANLELEKNLQDDGSRESERVTWVYDNPYGRYFNQFFRALFNLKKMGGRLSVEDSCNLHGLLTNEGPVFRGNIYPISRHDHMDWNNLDIFFEEKCLGKAPQVTGWSLEEYLENMISARKNVLLEKLEEISLRNGNRQAIVVCTATGQKNKFAKSFGVEEGSFEEIFFENSKGGSAYLAQIPGRNIDIIGWLYVIPFFRTSKGRLSFEEQRGYATALRSILMEKGAKVDLNLLGANY